MTTFLEQTSTRQISPSATPGESVVVQRAEEPSPEFNRFLETAVGGQWHWVGRLDWTWQQRYERITDHGFETWVGFLRGTPIGYAELHGRAVESHTEVEIESFGLLPAFIGRGFGGYLLTRVLEEAWAIDARWVALTRVRRVWLHTCNLDSAHALPNYLRRGFRQYDTRTTERDLDPTPPGPWPGADAPARPTPPRGRNVAQPPGWPSVSGR